MKEFLRKKNIIFSAKRYGIDALGAMAQGLFASLLIGTIISKAVDTALGRRKSVQASGKPVEMPMQDKTAEN